MNWKSKTLETLENDYWEEPKYSSHLVTRCNELRKKILNDFSIEDLRIMIGQNIGLGYLIPISLEKLTENILSEGDFYEGDLLLNVLRSDRNYWKLNRNEWATMCDLFKQKRHILENSENIESVINDWNTAFSEFEKINKK